MSSGDSNDLLSAFHDGETAAGERAVARELLERSREANRELKDYQRIGRLLQELPRVTASPEFAASVMQRAERESLLPLEPVAPADASPEQTNHQPGRGSRRRWILAGVASAVVAATLLVAFGLFNLPLNMPPRAAAPQQEMAILDKSNSEPALRRLAPPVPAPAAPGAPVLAKTRGEFDRRNVAAKTTNGPLGLSFKAAPASASAPTPAPNPAPAVVAREASPAPLAGPMKAQAPLAGPMKARAPLAGPMKARAPFAGPIKGADAGPVSGAVQAPAEEAERENLVAQKDKEQSLDRRLVLPANLKTAKVGDVVEALQRDGKQVMVVRLTVVNQEDALDGVQSLLVRNTSRTLENVEEIKEKQRQFAGGKAADVPKEALPGAPGDLICVYAEGSRDEMMGVLRGLQSEIHIQGAELTNTIPFTALEEFANRGAPANQQIGNRSSAQRQKADRSQVDGEKTSASPLAVRLPASTVNKIFAAKQAPAQSAQRRKPKSAGAGGLEIARELQNLARDESPTLNGQTQNGKTEDGKKSDAVNGAQVAKAPRRAGASRRAMAQKGRQNSRDAEQVASEEKSFQIFFVITDQSQPETPSQSKMGNIKLGSAKAGVRSARTGQQGQQATTPNAKQGPVQVPAAEPAAPSSSPRSP